MTAAPEPRSIAVRAFATPARLGPAPSSRAPGQRSRAPSTGPSEWSVVVDTETRSDAPQQLRFGVYQLRRGDELHAQGLFYDPATLTDDERSTLYRFASARGLTVHLLADFIDDIFQRYLFDLRGTGIGFNLPFDLARLAIAHAPARGRTMHGGFSFQLSPDKRRPRI
ncbi:MAG: hypothetical protein ACR2OO_01015 [Thermomicrobiales bacterium]